MAKKTAAAPLNNTVGGGNLGLFVQLKQNADGTFAAATATDVFGDTAGTVHVLGSHMETGMARDDKGMYSCPVTVIEDDEDTLNSLELLAPYSPAAQEVPEDQLEDNTIIGGSAGVYGDPSKPFFLFVLFRKILGGKERARFFVGQFDRAGGSDPMKAKTRNKFKFTVKSVDAQGLVTVLPTHARTAGMTAPTLSGGFAHGKVVTAA
jgi:hypothetical protein